MTELWFDTGNGELLVGAAVAEARLQEVGNMAVPLSALLDGTVECPKSLEIERRPVKEWSRDEIIQVGKWALSILESATTEPVTLIQSHFVRLYKLGLGPHWGRQVHFANMRDLRDETGSAKGLDKGHYDDWSTQDFAHYAANLSRRLNRRPRHQDYALWAKQQDGPGLWVINQRFGNIGNLNELAGFPNIRNWDNDDYITWGVRVMRANHGKDFTYAMMEELSRRRQGPSEFPICKRFGKWTKYKKLVVEQLQQEDQERAAQTASKLHECRAKIESGEYPSRCKTMGETELSTFAAAHALATHLGVRSPDNVTIALAYAAQPTGSFISTLRKKNMKLTAAEIEIEAVILDVYDDIWPPQETDESLRVA